MADPETGATSSTGLAELLRSRDVENVVVVGLATDYCVKATALDAVELGFSTTVIADAVRPVDLEDGDGERALDEMRAAGVAVA
jgi:nicotinamidase/pyrazinamidase